MKQTLAVLIMIGFIVPAMMTTAAQERQGRYYIGAGDAVAICDETVGPFNQGENNHAVCFDLGPDITSRHEVFLSITDDMEERYGSDWRVGGEARMLDSAQRTITKRFFCDNVGPMYMPEHAVRLKVFVSGPARSQMDPTGSPTFTPVFKCMHGRGLVNGYGHGGTSGVVDALFL